MLNAAAERWGIGHEDAVWRIPYVTLLYRFKAAQRFLPTPEATEDNPDLPDVASMGFDGLEIQ